MSDKPQGLALRLTDDSWSAAVHHDSAVRAELLGGLSRAPSALVEPSGFNAVVRPVLIAANATAIEVVDDHLLRVTLPTAPAYALVAPELLSWAVPAAALRSGFDLVIPDGWQGGIPYNLDFVKIIRRATDVRARDAWTVVVDRCERNRKLPGGLTRLWVRTCWALRRGRGPAMEQAVGALPLERLVFRWFLPCAARPDGWLVPS